MLYHLIYNKVGGIPNGAEKHEEKGLKKRSIKNETKDKKKKGV